LTPLNALEAVSDIEVIRQMEFVWVSVKLSVKVVAELKRI